MPPQLRIRDLAVRFGSTVALAELDLDVDAGSSVAVIGRNGSGKSTLLQAITGLVTPAAGTIETSRATVALVLQSTDVDPSVPIQVRDTVRMARYPSRGLLGRFRAEDHAAVQDALDRLDVADLADRQLHDLSGGQRQRVLVAQGLAQDADILLLDEPVTGLDLVSRQHILDVIDEERSRGRIVMVTTHNLDEARRCDQVVLLATTPIAIGAPAEVLDEDHLRQAFGGRVARVGDEVVLDDPHHHH